MNTYIENLLEPYAQQRGSDGGYVYIEGGNVSADQMVVPKLINLNASSLSIIDFDNNQTNSLFLFGDTTNFNLITPDTVKALNTFYICIQITKKDMRYDIPDQSIYILDQSSGHTTTTLDSDENTLYDGPFVNELLMELSGKPKRDLKQFQFVSNNKHKSLFNLLNYYITSELFSKVLNDSLGNGNYNDLYNHYNGSMDKARMIMDNHSLILITSYTIYMGLELLINKKNDDNTITFNITEVNSDLVINFYQKLMANEYVITDTENDITYAGLTNVNMNKEEKTITVRLKDFPEGNIPTDRVFKLTIKGVEYYKGEYVDREEQITNISKDLRETTDEYKGTIKTLNTVSSSYNYIDIYVGLMYIILFVIVLMLILGQEDIKPIFSLVMIGIIIVIYLIFLGMYSSTEHFSTANTATPTTPEAIESHRITMDNKMRDQTVGIAVLVKSYEPLVAVSDMYENILNVMQKDMNRLDIEKDLTNNRYHISRSHINQEWHDAYRSMAIVSALVIISVIILGYYFLASSMPQGNTYFVVLAVIGIVITIFYYYFKIAQNIRTRYNGFYWNA